MKVIKEESHLGDEHTLQTLEMKEKIQEMNAYICTVTYICTYT